MQLETQNPYHDINWAALYRKLFAVTQRCAGQMPHIVDGISPEDLTNIVLLAFLESSNGLGWSPKIGPLDKFLIGVLKHKMVDCLRRQGKIAGSIDDARFIARLEATQSPQTDRDSLLSFRGLQKEITN